MHGCSGSRDSRGRLQPQQRQGPNRGCCCLQTREPGALAAAVCPQKQEAHRQRKRPGNLDTQHLTLRHRITPPQYSAHQPQTRDKRDLSGTQHQKPTRTASYYDRRSLIRREKTETSNTRLAAPWTSFLDLDRHHPSRIYLREPPCRCLRARLGYPAPLRRPRSRLDPSRP